MPIDVEAIKAKFARTPEQAAEEVQYQAWKAEQFAWETKCYNEKISAEEFNQVRDEIDVKYGRTPTSKLLEQQSVYGIDAALAIFSQSGAPMSRQMFHQSVLDHLIKSGFARKIGGEPGEKTGGVWEFDLRYLQHWGGYIAEVRKRREDGQLPGNYEFSEFDMQCFVDGVWDE